jgi:putative endonuclease
MYAQRALWRSGEDLAASFYTRRGFRILARNYRAPSGEIDIVARRGSLLVFCEVKARATDRFGLPAEAVHRRKQARIKRLAGAWLSQNRPGRVRVRFDVVSVIVSGDRLDLTHLPGAF